MSENQLSADEVSMIWLEAKKRLELQLTPAVFNTWIISNPLTKILVVSPSQAQATFSCLTAFHATNLKKNLYSQLKNSLEEVLQKSLELSFVVGESNPTTTAQNSLKTHLKSPLRPVVGLSPTVDELFSAHTIQSSLVDRADSRSKQIGLRADYTFQAFAVSTSNEMAHAAASAVSNNPGSSYNPLFLYGGVGVGKTHLMHAIGHNILQQNPETQIIYCTGEEFTNEIVSAIQTKKAFDFKKKYRNAQVLLIDDIQFIAGKNAVQEEFFHTFNALTKQSSQIVLTSDRPPHEIILLEDRLKSRFEAGLMIDIQQPSFELRTAILLIKSAAVGVNIPMNLAQQIASSVDSARKIEGIIAILKSEVELHKREINSELVSTIIQNENNQPKKTLRVKPQDVIKTVANHYRVKQTAIKGKSRTKDLVLARHVAMYLLREELKMSLEEIGDWFSGRDHTSVLHASQKIDGLMPIDIILKQDISALKMTLLAISP